ncbi:MAG TPA: universal stress protein [Thermoleophilaceae bacterium]
MIVIGYDGSADAEAAINYAGDLFPGETALICTVWEPFVDVMARSGAGLAAGFGDLDIVALDAENEGAARARADEGVERASRAGLQAEARVRARGGTVAGAILAEAEQANARAIVLGTRGLTGIKSLLLGSVSHAVVQHADRAVVIVPSAELAEARERKRG